MMIIEATKKLIAGEQVSKEEAKQATADIMNGVATEAQIAAYLTALRIKGETVEHITGTAEAMLDACIKIKINKELIDTCGTGGDGLHTFNISTIVAFIVAGCGFPVAKHGNRSISSKCGSADLLKELGVKIDADKEVVERCIEEANFGFIFAPKFHPAMKYAMPVRQQLGYRTIFNIVGPLTNPASVDYQLMGVYDGELTEPLAYVLKNLGRKIALVVHGEDGMDEVSISGKTKISCLKNDKVNTFYIMPEEFGMKRAPLDKIKSTGVKDNAKLTLELLSGEIKEGPIIDVVLLNAGCALFACNKANNIKEGIEMAKDGLLSGKAEQVLEKLIKYSNM